MWGGLPAPGSLVLGGACSGREWGSAPGGVWRPPMMANAVGGMHPTGMHSSFILITVTRVFNCGFLVHSTC